MALALVAALLAVSPASANPKEKAPPNKAPVSVTKVVAEQEPGVVAAARLAPRTGTEDFGWELRSGLMVKNHGKEPVTLTKMTADTDVTSPQEGDIWIEVDEEVDGETVKKQLPFVIGAGATTYVAMPVTIAGTAPPVPTKLGVMLHFEGYSTPTVVTRPVAIRMNATPTGGYRFPAKAEDLRIEDEEVYWAQGNGFHADTRSQRYGYDLANRAYNSAKGEWSERRWDEDGEYLDAEENGSYWIFGRPVYAMHDGTVLGCRRSISEEFKPPLSEGDTIEYEGGGNGFWIDHGNGEVALYAHLQGGSVPPALCPTEVGDNNALNAEPVKVRAGDYLGRVGNTGASSHPHIHIHVQDAPPTNWLATGNAEGLPLNFHHVDTRVWPGFDPTEDEPNWAHLFASKPAALGPGALFNPNPCGWIQYPPGASEVAHHGVPASCWQDTVDAIVAAGYQMSFLDAFETDGQVFFNGIFRPASGEPWAAVHGLTSQAYQDTVESHDQAGRRLLIADSYLENGSVRYAAIFGPETGPWAAYHGRSQAEHQAEFEALKSNGFHPVSVSVVSHNGELRYTAVYDTQEVGSWVLDSTVAVADYQSFFDAQVQAGRKVAHLNAYEHAGGIWFSVLAWSAGPDIVAGHGLTGAQYQQAWEETTGAGHRTRLVTGYDGGRDARYAAVWELTGRDPRPGDGGSGPIAP